jgi:hypothetical protein
MIPSTATPQLIQQARIEALAVVGGGLEKKFNDLQSYGTTAGTSGASFLISHIPIVGPVLAKAFDIAASIGINKLYEKLLSEATTREQRITYCLFLLERSLSASIRQAYNTMNFYNSRAQLGEVECKDCQDAFREAKIAYLAQDCMGDLEAACKILGKLKEDLEAETSQLKMKVDSRVNNLVSRIDNFRDNHKQSTCIGTQRCYWIPGPGTVFSSVRNEDL